MRAMQGHASGPCLATGLMEAGEMARRWWVVRRKEEGRSERCESLFEKAGGIRSGGPISVCGHHRRRTVRGRIGWYQSLERQQLGMQ